MRDSYEVHSPVRDSYEVYSWFDVGAAGAITAQSSLRQGRTSWAAGVVGLYTGTWNLGRVPPNMQIGGQATLQLAALAAGDGRPVAVGIRTGFPTFTIQFKDPAGSDAWPPSGSRVLVRLTLTMSPTT